MRVLTLLFLFTTISSSLLANWTPKELFIITPLGKTASFQIHSKDTTFSSQDFKTSLTYEHPDLLQDFNQSYKSYKLGNTVTTIGFVMMPLGFLGDQVIWNNKSYLVDDYPFPTRVEGEPVYTGLIVGSTVFVTGLVMRYIGVKKLKTFESTYNSKVRLNIEPTIISSHTSKPQMGLRLAISF